MTEKLEFITADDARSALDAAISRAAILRTEEVRLQAPDARALRAALAQPSDALVIDLLMRLDGEGSALSREAAAFIRRNTRAALEPTDHE